MARNTVVVFEDDITGKEITGTPETVKITLNGATVELDIDPNSEAFKILTNIHGKGRRVSGVNNVRDIRSARHAAPTRTQKERNQAIRQWLRDNGVNGSDRGRIPGDLVAAYDAQDPNLIPATFKGTVAPAALAAIKGNAPKPAPKKTTTPKAAPAPEPTVRAVTLDMSEGRKTRAKKTTPAKTISQPTSATG